MAQLVPNKIDDPTNPLQPGDPFRRRNFSRFALGMCLIAAIVLAAAIAFLFFRQGHEPTPRPAPSSRSTVIMPGAIAA